ncbi:DUF4386 domain-containing protein [Cellulomonas sp. McL0617]|uniref:DUF4386 domain-containing protein n=1 Tax=Cellulomonas sp. McL0617 TaxID=3415675 RepID=UPI003CF8CF8B
MTTIERTQTPTSAKPSTLRRTARIAGWLYLATFVTSIPARALYGPALEHGWILGSGSVAGVQLGLVLDVLCALAGIGTAVALFPVVRRQSEGVALAFVGSRTLEAAGLVLGVVSLFAVVTLRQAGGEAATLSTTGDALVALHTWAYLVGPGVLSGVNALLLGSLMYRSRLVPRVIPLVGLIGAPLLLASDVATMFGAFGQFSSPAAVAAFPVALWELSVGLWMAFKGFRPSPITADLV